MAAEDLGTQDIESQSELNFTSEFLPRNSPFIYTLVDSLRDPATQKIADLAGLLEAYEERLPRKDVLDSDLIALLRIPQATSLDGIFGIVNNALHSYPAHYGIVILSKLINKGLIPAKICDELLYPEGYEGKNLIGILLVPGTAMKYQPRESKVIHL